MAVAPDQVRVWASIAVAIVAAIIGLLRPEMGLVTIAFGALAGPSMFDFVVSTKVGKVEVHHD